MTDREILINLIAGLSLADHLGDVYEDCEKALELAGVEVPSTFDPDHWQHLAYFLSRELGATTIWGTPLMDDDNDRS